MSNETEHIWIEGVGSFTVHEPPPAETHQRELNAAAADAMHTPAGWQAGRYHEVADVRRRVVTRLIARGPDDPATIPTLFDVLQHDPSPAVRGTVAFSLVDFPDDARVVAALETSAGSDTEGEARDDARYGLTGFVESAQQERPAIAEPCPRDRWDVARRLDSMAGGTQLIDEADDQRR